MGFIDHHEAHAHTARLVGAPDAMLVTMDGYGDGLAGTFDATGPKRRDFKSPGHSLALVYGAITRLLGFGEGDEGKVMGLAASGDKERLADFFERCMSAGGCDPTLGGRQQREWLKSQPREDVAAALQARTESLAKEWIEQSRGNRVRLAVSGGLFANVSLNGRLAEAFDHFDCFPHMGDGGLCVGALASAVPELRFGLPFTGPTWTDEQVRRAIDDGGLCGERSEDPEGQLLETILDGGITARFYGRSEFGPRALGHRSILMRADRPGLADRLNQQLGRNDFMPFAPIRRLGAGSLTMTVVVEADRTLRERCPAAVHVDGSVRTQLAHPRADPGLWSLLGRAEAAGLPALINTSFNRHGEPIVESPTDAVRTFKAAGLDVMQMGRFVVRAKPGSIDRP
ncbi:MAG: carbamoyltransferase [Myxococcota bacterium]